MKLTASKLSRGALASADSGKRTPRDGRSDVSVGTEKGTGSCKSGKEESRDDFELHIVCFFCFAVILNTEYCTKDCLK